MFIAKGKQSYHFFMLQISAKNVIKKREIIPRRENCNDTKG